jgi:hypothetical protein
MGNSSSGSSKHNKNPSSKSNRDKITSGNRQRSQKRRNDCDSTSLIQNRPPSSVFRSTVWIKLQSPGQKLKLRSTPNIDDGCVGYLRNNDEFQVYIKTINGFFQLVDNRVSLLINEG